MSIQESYNIAERAYLIWEQTGRPEGRALEHWLQAEAEISAPSAPAAQNSKAAATSKPARRKTT